MTRCLSLLVALLVAAPAFAKPLYLTVPRAYGSDEVVSVDVAFAGREPVELRVLKPVDLDAFIKAQSNLRRAWTEPPLQANPGRYLARGLNAVESPGHWWRDALDPRARELVSPALPPSTENRRLGSRLAQTAPKLVGTPPGMEVVRTEWLNLDLGGIQQDFHVPGFDEWQWQGGGFEERRVTLAPLPTGVYVLQLVQGAVEGQVTLVVSDLSMQVKQTDGLVLVRVAGKDLKPQAGVKVALHSQQGPGTTGTTDDKGEVRLPATETKLLVTAARGQDVALADTDFYSTLAVSPDVFVYSDRPIYKPGDEVSFRGLVRKPDSFLARLFTPRTRRVTVKLDPGVSTTATVDAYGAFHGTLKVSEKMEPGVVRLVAQVEEQTHQAEARVREYVKPTFYLEVQPESETVTPGGKLRATVKARRYAGGPAKNTKYEVTLYRTMLESPAWVDDAGLGGEGSAVTYGSVSTTEAKLSVQHRLYSSVTERLGQWGGDDPWASAPSFDEEGMAFFEVDVPPLEPGDEQLPWRYSLTVNARDDQGSTATGGASLYLADCEVLGALSSSARLVRAGAEAGLSARATTLSNRPYGITTGVVKYALRRADGSTSPLDEQPLKTDADGVWRGAWPTKEIGTVVATVTLEDRHGKQWTGEETLLVAGEGGEAVAAVPALTLETLGGVFEPGQRAEIVALLPPGWGVDGTSKGSLWITLSGTGIHSTALVPVDGRTYVHRFVIEKRFGSAVHVSVAHPTPTGRWEERTTALRIVPKERALSVQVQPRRVEATPLGPQEIDLRVVDYQGRGVTAQVSLGVVDKAVYAVQKEFRPHVLDFFYPLVRNNVSTFYSAEFQGYGYGEVLARQLRSLSPYQFAAIKPPSKRANDKERDTAYWNASVLTDGDGRASVRFNLPANQTLWVATAVAADASGRFGEGTAEFASRGGLNVVASLPQFLRAGDVAQASVRVARGVSDQAPGPRSLQVSLAAQGAFEASKSDEKLTLEPGGEAVVPVTLTASKDGAGQVAVTITGDEKARDERLVAVQPATIEETISRRSWGGGDMSLAVPAGASVSELTLSLRPSTVDVALSTVRELMTYPYGCLEQLIATTIPNVAVYRALEETGAIAKLDTGSQELLEQARSRAVLGTGRILDLAVKGGGFTWFSGYSTPSPAQTLIALDGLAYAVEAGLIERGDTRLVESARWIASQDLPPELDALRAWVMARLEGPRAAAHVRAYLDRVEPGDLYSTSMAILSARVAGVDEEASMARRLSELANQVKPQLAGLATWTPAADRFRALPLRRTALSAIASHALLQDRNDVPAARRMLVESLSTTGLSTYDRSTALLHGLWLLRNDARELKAGKAPVVKVDQGGVALDPSGFGFESPLSVKARAVDVGSFDGVAVLTAKLMRPYDSVTEQADGLAVTRAYYVLRGDARVRLEPGTQVFAGEEVHVELSVDTIADEKTARLRSAYTVVEDAVPAGFEALDEDKQFRGAPYHLELTHPSVRRREIGVERVTFFIEEPAHWSRSPRTIGYVMRARFPGKFAAPPAFIEDMYASTLRGRSAPATLEVVASK